MRMGNARTPLEGGDLAEVVLLAFGERCALHDALERPDELLGLPERPAAEVGAQHRGGGLADGAALALEAHAVYPPGIIEAERQDDAWSPQNGLKPSALRSGASISPRWRGRR